MSSDSSNHGILPTPKDALCAIDISDCQRQSGSKGGVVVLEPLGDGFDSRDPESLLKSLGVGLVDSLGREVKPVVSFTRAAEKKREKWERELKKLESSVNYGARRERKGGVSVGVS